MDRALKKQIVTAVKLVFLSALVDQLTVSGQVSALQMLHQLFTSYGEIDEVDLEENAAKMIGSYELMEHLACLIEQL